MLTDVDNVWPDYVVSAGTVQFREMYVQTAKVLCIVMDTLESILSPELSNVVNITYKTEYILCLQCIENPAQVWTEGRTIVGFRSHRSYFIKTYAQSIFFVTPCLNEENSYTNIAQKRNYFVAI